MAKLLDKVNNTALNTYIAVKIAISEKRQAIDTLGFAIAVVGLVVGAFVLMMIVGSGQDDQNSLMGMFNNRVRGMIGNIFSKGDKVIQ